MTPLPCWRHPKPRGAAGHCIGSGSDVAVDPRKAKRLAHRIRTTARKQGLAHEVWTSPLRRAADVGRWLKRWGWRHHVDARLNEVFFGAWEGRRWADIPVQDIDAWAKALWRYAPGGGESVRELVLRVRSFVAEAQAAGAPRCVVTHGGWLSALRALDSLGADAEEKTVPAATWPPAPRYGALLLF